MGTATPNRLGDEALTDLDAELAALEQRRAKTRALMQGMVWPVMADMGDGTMNCSLAS